MNPQRTGQRTWRGVAAGVTSGAVSRMLRLPFNPTLRSYNVFEAKVDPGVVDEVGDLYARHIAPARDVPDGCFQSGPYSFYAKRPDGWGSDIRFWSAADLATYERFADVFRRLDLDARQFPGADPARGLRVYSASLMTRSWCETTHFHTDFFPTCSTAVYTLITPLGEPPRDGGQFVYRDRDGDERVYRYARGAALIFGALLSHGTQVHPRGDRQALLSFTFSTDHPTGWRAVQRALELKRTLDYCGCWRAPR